VNIVDVWFDLVWFGLVFDRWEVLRIATGRDRGHVSGAVTTTIGNLLLFDYFGLACDVSPY